MAYLRNERGRPRRQAKANRRLKRRHLKLVKLTDTESLNIFSTSSDTIPRYNSELYLTIIIPDTKFLRLIRLILFRLGSRELSSHAASQFDYVCLYVENAIYSLQRSRMRYLILLQYWHSVYYSLEPKSCIIVDKKCNLRSHFIAHT
jgi:hypothetical protein